MLWYLGQSWLIILLSFLLGLLLGWLMWRRSTGDRGTAAGQAREAVPERPVEPVAELETTAEPERAAEPEPEPEPAVEPEPEPEPAAEPEPAPEPAAVVTSATVADKLTRVEGIGPKIDGALRAAGIGSFAELAAADEARLRAALTDGGLRFAPSLLTWARQAALLAAGDEQGFRALTAELTAGRGAGRRS